MKIILMNYMETTAPGGINKVVKEISKNLSKIGHEITVIQSNPLDLPNEELHEGFKIIRVNSKISFYDLSPEMYLFLKNNLRKLDPDIIHVHGYHTLFSVEVVNTIRSMDSTIPLVFSPYLDIYRSSFAGKYFWNIYKLFGKKTFEKSSHIISCSNFEAQATIDIFNVKNKKISLIPLGVDTVEYGKRKDVKDKINLLYSGYLIDRKGVDFILKSLYSLVHDLKVKNVNLTIIGEGPEKRKLLKLANKLNLDDYVKWESFLPKKVLMKTIKESDIFMLLSNSEAYGITVAEALALGTPCIVTNTTALSEFIQEKGCFGVKYPPNPREVAELITEIHKNNVDVGPFSEKIRTWEEVSKDYENIYMNLLKG